MSSKHYINNRTLLEELVKHRENCAKAAADGLIKPRIPEYIGECFFKIATRLSTKWKFVNYTYRDEMISDAIENCLAVVNNFDPAKSKNPFAYFTQITFFAFVRRIQREKKQMATKFRYIDQLDVSDIVTQEHDNGDFQNQFLEYLKTQMDNYEYEKVTSTIIKKEDKTPVDIDTNDEV